MSLSNHISHNSLKKIFECLDTDYSTVAKFSRTNYGIYKFATEHNFFRVKASEVDLIYGDYEHSVQLNIYIRIPGSYENYKVKLVHERRIIVDHGPVMSAATASKILSHLEAKIKSIHYLTIEGFTIDAGLLKMLRETILGSIKYLKLYEGTFAIDEQQFSDILQHLKLETLIIGDTDMNTLRLNTVHLSLASRDMTVFPNVDNGSLYFPEIGDQLFTNWLYRPPGTMSLQSIRTGFTLQGVLKFIEKFCRKISDKKFSFRLGYVGAKEGFEKEIFLAQRKSKINWCNYDGLFFQATSVNVNRSVCFYIEKNVSHITKGQARLKIAQLEADILAKIEENPLYNVYADESVSAEIEKLSEAVKRDWKDVKREVARLYSLNEPAFDEDDEDSEDSEED